MPRSMAYLLFVLATIVGLGSANARFYDETDCLFGSTIDELKDSSDFTRKALGDEMKPNRSHEEDGDEAGDDVLVRVVEIKHKSAPRTFFLNYTFDDSWDGGNTLGWIETKSGKLVATIGDSEIGFCQENKRVKKYNQQLRLRNVYSNKVNSGGYKYLAVFGGDLYNSESWVLLVKGDGSYRDFPLNGVSLRYTQEAKSEDDFYNATFNHNNERRTVKVSLNSKFNSSYNRNITFKLDNTIIPVTRSLSAGRKARAELAKFLKKKKPANIDEFKKMIRAYVRRASVEYDQWNYDDENKMSFRTSGLSYEISNNFKLNLAPDSKMKKLLNSSNALDALAAKFRSDDAETWTRWSKIPNTHKKWEAYRRSNPEAEPQDQVFSVYTKKGTRAFNVKSLKAGAKKYMAYEIGNIGVETCEDGWFTSYQWQWVLTDGSTMGYQNYTECD